MERRITGEREVEERGGGERGGGERGRGERGRRRGRREGRREGEGKWRMIGKGCKREEYLRVAYSVWSLCRVSFVYLIFITE